MKRCNFGMLPVFVAMATACSSSSGSSGAPAPGPAPAPITSVFVEAALANTTDAPATHDQIFGGLRDQSAKLGNVGHTAFVGDQAKDRFLAIDTWNDPKGLDSFLHDPNVAAADSKLFAGAPRVTVANPRDGWYGWGSFSRTLPDGKPAVVATIRGKIAGDPEAAKQIHNDGSKGAQSLAQGAGDLGHVVFLDASDAQTFLVVDVWTNAAGAQAFYASPQLQKGFSFLAGAPEIALYDETSWIQW
jgi:quinol monooxygenase YgiN